MTAPSAHAAAGGPPLASEGAARTAGVAELEPRLVLLVEDDAVLCEYIAECLRDAGYEVARAGDGVSALRLLAHRPPRAVVLDLDVPGISGFRLLRLLRRDPDPALANLPVVVTSGYHQQEAREVFASGRPEAYLHKPYAAVALLERLSHLVAPAEPRLVRGQAA